MIWQIILWAVFALMIGCVGGASALYLMERGRR